MPSGDQIYDAAYYETSLGPTAYERNEYWLDFFDRIAGAIVDRLRPATVLDAGCAIGLLVETLRSRGVEASGFDVSDHAIQAAHPSVADHVRVGSLTEPLDGHYDLVTCIEVLEHIEPADVDLALKHLASVTDQVLLSSTPDDYVEPTHLNVQPPDYWAARFASHGLFHDVDFDASFLTPWAMLLRREDPDRESLVRRYERDRWLLTRERDALRQAALDGRAHDVEPADNADDVGMLRDRLREAIDAAHAADARRATVEGRLGHVEFALAAAEAREAEIADLVDELHRLTDGDIRRLEALLGARTYQVYWRLLAPYRWLRDRRS